MKQATISQPPQQWRDLPVYKPGIPLIGSTQGFFNDPLTFHLEPYRRWGSIYRTRFLTEMHLVLAGPEAREFIYRNADLWSYSQRMDTFREAFDEMCVFQLDGEAHRKKRYRITPGFKPAALVPLVPNMQQALDDKLAALPAEDVDLRLLCKLLTVSMTSQAVLKVDLPKRLDAQIDAFSHYMLFGQSLGPLSHLWHRFPPYARLRHTIFTTVERMLDQRARDPAHGEDILSAMLMAQPASEPPPSHAEIVNDLIFLLQAGTQTAAHLILWALMYIYHHPAWLAALREELCSWSPAAFTSMNDWPRLLATIYEVERLRPPVPFFIMIPAENFEYRGVHISKGTPVFYPSALSHFLPELYDDPMRFKPQRFLSANAVPHKTHSTYGGGRHFCPGQSLGRLKILLALAHIVSNYDLVFKVQPSFEPRIRVVTTPIEASMPVRFVPRHATR